MAGLARIEERIAGYLELRETRAYDAVGGVGFVRTQNALSRRTDRILDPMTTQIEDLRLSEEQESADAQEASNAADGRMRSLLLLSVGLALIVGLLVVVLLSRNMVPRIKRYSQFASRIASGGAGERLDVNGTDELAVLGRALNDMVDQRRSIDAREQAQTDFVDALQVTSTEQEAHELIQRRLEQSLPASDALLMQRNNSANRLQPVETSLALNSEMAIRLQDAEPRTCLAVRFARSHQEALTSGALLACHLCAGRELASVCEPLLWAGR